MARNSEERATDFSIYEHFSYSFASLRSGLSTKGNSFAEGLAAYAEQVEDDMEPGPVADSMVGSYNSPDGATTAQELAADSVRSAKISLAPSDAATRNQKAVAAAKGATSGKKYKRPRLARISKWVRRRFSRKNNATASV